MSRKRRKALPTEQLQEPPSEDTFEGEPEVEWRFARSDATREGFESWRNWSDELRPGRKRGRHGTRRRHAKRHRPELEQWDEDLPGWAAELADDGSHQGRRHGRRGHPVYF